MANEKHLLLTFGGTYTNTENQSEVWQNGYRIVLDNHAFDNVGTLPNYWNPVAQDINRTETDWTITGNWRADFGLGTFFNPDDYLNDQVAPALAAWHNVQGISSQTRLDWAKIFPIGPNGKAVPAPPYSQGSPILLTWTSGNPVGVGGANPLPLQNALVVSHRSNQVGRKGRGRIFRAGIDANCNNSSAEVPSSITTGMVSHEIDLLEALAISGTGPTSIHTRPAVIGSPWTQYGVITQVRVGNRIDTQRRRRQQVVESYDVGSPSY